MKRILFFTLTIAALAALTSSCNKVSYQKTKSGLLYKIISSDSKDSVVKPDQWLKLNFVQRLNDSVMQTTYGKMPVYVKVPSQVTDDYSPLEIFGKLKTGDSAIAVMLVDSLLAKKLMQELPPFMKKGDKINWGFKVITVFANDSLYAADQRLEAEKDAPRRAKEEADQMAEMQKKMQETRDASELEMEKSGEAAKGIKAMQDFLASKNITAKQVGKGTFVQILQEGTGAQAADGKYVTCTFTGRKVANDSLFPSGSGTLSRQLGQGQLIPGMEEGLKALKEGGKGVLYIPGFRGYGANPPPGSPFAPFEPLKFEVKIDRVADTPDSTQMQPEMPRG